MSDYDMDTRLRSWARSASGRPAPAELRRLVHDIPANEPTTRRRRWRSFLPARRPTAGADERGSRAESTLAIDSTGGIRTMFSATKLVGIAAAVALFGALTLALPFGSQDSQLPAASAPSLGGITPWTGEMRILGKDTMGSAEGYDWGSSMTDEQWTSRLTTTDSRYSGLVTGLHSYYEVNPGDGFTRVHTSRVFTNDDGGTWLSSGYGYQDPETSSVTYVTHSTGEGIYAGLSGFGICEQQYGSLTMECHGITFEGEWPAFPSAAPDEIPAIWLAQQ